ncbi:hypothetical protein KZX46_00400 (plasmid) [Polymorphobacter sp. PAMC 29334]|uniref:hypothetical protein n=1 Tax=Polymorphobacter sp. PAMC 29334 TaxID=2862331 RepID=UPI001C78EF08|nr:hypothetical protein [Polymorphobacter sp. PAMC 29334]QYE33303.1 hypothetical protein KZX46_00400 [Polymorphobacter sp. PAMC 29334]
MSEAFIAYLQNEESIRLAHGYPMWQIVTGCDFGIQKQLELPGASGGQQLRIARRHPRLVSELQAAQPLEIEVAFR